MALPVRGQQVGSIKSMTYIGRRSDLRAKTHLMPFWNALMSGLRSQGSWVRSPPAAPFQFGSADAHSCIQPKYPLPPQGGRPLTGPIRTNQFEHPRAAAEAQAFHVMPRKKRPADELNKFQTQKSPHQWAFFLVWLREQDLNLRPLGYEPNELPGCSIARQAVIIALKLRLRRKLVARFPKDGQPVQPVPWGHCHPRENPFSGYGCSHPDGCCNAGPVQRTIS